MTANLQPAMPASTREQALALTNALTVDVEDYFQVSALAPHIERASWGERPCRVERNVSRLWRCFSPPAHATFSPWMDSRALSALVRETSPAATSWPARYAHLRASDQDPAEFRQDVRHAKQLLEDSVATRSGIEPELLVGYTNHGVECC